MTENWKVTNEQIKNLRELGHISPDEIAFIVGDLLMAEQVTTGKKRIVGESSLLTESCRRVLKG